VPVPTFLVVGAARAGTTALIEGLRLHPDAFVTMPKEPHYFGLHGRRPTFAGPGDEAAINAVAVTDRMAYLGLYDVATTETMLGDGSVSTLYYAEHAVDEIRRMNPEMRAVVLLREPVDRAFSNHLYMRARGVEPLIDVRAAIELEPRRRADNWHHMWHYTSVSRYADSLAILQAGLGRDRVGVWFYDDLQADYQRVLDEVRAFLALAPFPDGVPTLPKVNVSGSPRSEVAQRIIRWSTRHEHVRSAIKRVVGFRARERIRRTVLRTEAVPADVRRDLEPLFRDDVARLATMLEGPAPEWLRPAAEPDPVDEAR
jgi:hypothetical protein